MVVDLGFTISWHWSFVDFSEFPLDEDFLPSYWECIDRYASASKFTLFFLKICYPFVKF